MATITAQRVLVVDEEPLIVDAVAATLRCEGFDVSEATTGRTALAAAQAMRPDLVVLDVMLPDLDGFEVTRRMRAEGILAPVLFLTAKDTVQEKVIGLTVGGDDYMVKPFSLSEVVVRARAILRRTGRTASDPDARLVFADVVLDEESHEAFRSSVPISLTATEFSLLGFFMRNPRRVLSKAQILDHVWHYDFGGDSNVVETYVSYVRKKLDAHGPSLIHTIRRAGYVLGELDG